MARRWGSGGTCVRAISIASQSLSTNESRSLSARSVMLRLSHSIGLLLVQREDKLDVVFGEGRAVSEAADAAEEQPRDDLKA